MYCPNLFWLIKLSYCINYYNFNTFKKKIIISSNESLALPISSFKKEIMITFWLWPDYYTTNYVFIYEIFVKLKYENFSILISRKKHYYIVIILLYHAFYIWNWCPLIANHKKTQYMKSPKNFLSVRIVVKKIIIALVDITHKKCKGHFHCCWLVVKNIFFVKLLDYFLEIIL